MSPHQRLRRRLTQGLIGWGAGLGAGAAWAKDAKVSPPKRADVKSASDVDPLDTHIWPDMRREMLGADARVVFDNQRVEVQGPGFAEDPMNVPIAFRIRNVAGVRRIVVMVDRNPIRRVLEYFPVEALPALAFRFKLEQASAVRVAALGADGRWVVGHTLVDSSGGGCTVSGASRKDGSWSTTLGQGQARTYASSSSQAAGDSALRLRLRLMHPMDTGLVGGVPAFYVSKLSVRDARQRELARLLTFEPVSENPVFSFDFATPPPGPLTITGVDNNGNRINVKTS